MGVVKIYDFKKSQKFSAENISVLTLLCEEFCKTSNIQLNYELKYQNVKLNINRTQQISYGDFLDSIESKSILAEYEMYPMIQNMIFSLDKHVSLILIDLVSGGDGKVNDLNRDLTDIDRALLKYLIDGLLKRMYTPENLETAKVVDIYNNKAQFQGINIKESIFICDMTVTLGTTIVGRINLCIPYGSMEPILEELLAKKIYESKNNDSSDDMEGAMFDNIQEVKLDVIAILGQAKLSVSDLLNTEEGDIILLSQKISNDVDISVGSSKTFRGRPGLVGNKKGAIINDSIKGERRND